MSSETDVPANVLAVFRRCDTSGCGEIARPVMKRLLNRLNSPAWSDAKVEELLLDWSDFKKGLGATENLEIIADGSNSATTIRYEDFIFWLFSEAELSNSMAVSRRSLDFTVMTFNVEEYWHGSDTPLNLHSLPKAFAEKNIDACGIRDYFKKIRTHIFHNITATRNIIEECSPDILCLTEHSLGLEVQFLRRCGLDAHVDRESLFSHKEILMALLPNGYDVFVQPTGEFAKYSGLANAVAWKKSKFEKCDVGSQVGVLITPPKKKTTCGSVYTPRSVACVQLRLVGVASAPPVIACSTHLMGGRFEDRNWAADHEAGVNERVNQVCAIEHIINEHPSFTRGSPSIIAGDFNVMRKGFLSGPFADSARDYVFGRTILYPRHKLERHYIENYVPYQTAVHRKLEEFGFCCAYGQEDDQIQMKTSLRGSGCVDWIYIKGLSSWQDERVISAKRKDALGDREITDHDAVIVTLRLSDKYDARSTR